jgi:hypothetical protein
VSDRSGCGLTELAVLESLAGLMSDAKRRRFVKTSRVLAGIEDKIGLGPRLSYPMLVDLTRPWLMAAPLVALRGDGGDRLFPEPADAQYTESRPSGVGQLVLDAEAGKLAPVPVGLINGTTYRGGMQPALDPARIVAAAHKLLDDAQTSDAELLSIVGPPYSPADCTITGNLNGLFAGKQTEIRESAKITITSVAVPEPRLPRQAIGRSTLRAFTGSAYTSPPAHLIIESLPAHATIHEAETQIAMRSGSHDRRDDSPASGPARNSALALACRFTPSILDRIRPLTSRSRSTSRSTWSWNQALTRPLSGTSFSSWTASHRKLPGLSRPRLPECSAAGSALIATRTCPLVSTSSTKQSSATALGSSAETARTVSVPPEADRTTPQSEFGLKP